MSSSRHPRFPCLQTPEDGPDARLLGLYDQRQDGYLLQRLKLPAGRLSLPQWRAVARAALRWSRYGRLHLTTRQDLEIHGLTSETVPALQRALHQAALSTVGAAGDTPRNLTLCPECGLKPGGFDLLPLASALQRAMDAMPGIYRLPRKFKISFSGCLRPCARPWINDLGFVAHADGTFQVIVGGSLGAPSGTGIRWYGRLRLDEVIPFAVGTLRLFEAEGDRERRSRARLRHVRERLGDARFRQCLEATFHAAKREPVPSVPALKPCDGPQPALTRVHIPRGNLHGHDALNLIERVARHKGEIRIGLEHDLLMVGLTPDQLPAPFIDLVDAPRIIACPGAHTCTRGLASTWDMAEALRRALPARADLMVGISGCPNHCAHSTVADIGLVGTVKRHGGKPRPCYRLLAGGGRGECPLLARQLHPAVPGDRIEAVIRTFVDQWAAGLPDRSLPFTIFIEREHRTLQSLIARQCPS